MDTFSASKTLVGKIFSFNIMFYAGGITSLWKTTDSLNRSDNAEYTRYFSTSPNFETRTNTKVSAFRTGNHETTVMTHPKSIQSSKPTLSTAVVSTLTTPGDVFGPGNTPNNNTILVAIGGVIGLFLGILVLQMCVKILMSRKKTKKQLSAKHDSLKEEEEETYEIINDATMITSAKGDDEINNARQPVKYHELKIINLDNVMPYQTISLESNPQITSSLVKGNHSEIKSLSSSSDSIKSKDSYLNPTTSRIEPHSYIDIVEEDNFRKDLLIDVTEKQTQNKLLESALYLEPVHSGGNNVELCGLSDDSNAYLTVVK